MTVKRFSLRFNLDREDDRKAWDAIHRMDARTVNKEIIARINSKEQMDVLKDFIRQVVSEELTKATNSGSFSQAVQNENGAEDLENVFNFLDSF